MKGPFLSIQKHPQMPLRIEASAKRDSRSQFAALPWRKVDGAVQVLLITSRRTGRWILPKGWPEDGLTPGECAAKEAWEEAGVTGRVVERCVGIFSYQKVTEAEPEGLPCVTMVFPLRVKKQAGEWPEKAERRRKWFTLKQAANRVNEPELATLLRGFDPKTLS
ncbi:MAG: NUDIX hydrolase [Shimia sp.]